MANNASERFVRLLGTTVSPGFEFEDFEVGTRNQMLELFPNLRKEIERYTRE